MANIVLVSVADLLVDEENPRLAQPNEGQREALRALSTYQERKLQVIAGDILAHGLDPSQMAIVMPLEDDQKRYVVLDGNRRLTALRALENPEFLVDAVSPSIVKAIRKLSRQYQDAPIETTPCVVVKDRDEARHWISLRHTPRHKGAGPESWGPEESNRFRARTDGLPIQTQALNFLEQHGDITPEFRQGRFTTTYMRILNEAKVRAKVGIEFKDGQLKILGDENAVAKALLYIAQNLKSGNINVNDVRHKEQRVAYADNLPKDIIVTPTRKSGQGVAVGSELSQAPKKKSPVTVRPRKPRDVLIPRDCPLNITDERLREIETELRRLSLENYTNAVSVLFRVFIELGVDTYIDRTGLPTNIEAGLITKLLDVTRELIRRKKLTGQQAKAVRRACQADSFLAPSVTLMHQYVHNPYLFPTTSELRAGWNNLQSFISAIWAP